MKLESNLKEDFEVIAEDCTLAQALVMVENWCADNEAMIDWKNSSKELWADFFVYCIKDNEIVNLFVISE